MFPDGSSSCVVGDQVVATVGAGQTIGEMALLDGRPHSATVIARGQLHALMIDAEHFAQLLAHSPAVAKALLRELSGRVRELDLKVTEVYPR